LLHTAFGLHSPEDSSVAGPISEGELDAIIHAEGKDDSEGDSDRDSEGAAAEKAIRAAVAAPLLKVLVHVGKALPEPVDEQQAGDLEGGAAEPLLPYSGQLALVTRQREVGKWVHTPFSALSALVPEGFRGAGCQEVSPVFAVTFG